MNQVKINIFNRKSIKKDVITSKTIDVEKVADSIYTPGFASLNLAALYVIEDDSEHKEKELQESY